MIQSIGTYFLYIKYTYILFYICIFTYVCVCTCKTRKDQSFQYMNHTVTCTEATPLCFCTRERPLTHPRHIWAIIRAAQLHKLWAESALLSWRAAFSVLMWTPAFSHCLLHCHNSTHSPFVSTSFTSVLCSQTTQLLSHRRFNQLTIQYFQIFQSKQKEH